ELHAVKVRVVGVLARLAAVAREVDEAVLGVNFDDPAGAPRAAREGVLERAVAAVAVVVAPPRPLRPPEQFVVLLDVPRGLHVEERGVERFAEEALAIAGEDVEGADLQVALEPVAANEPQLAGTLAPAQVAVALVLPLRRDLRERLLVHVAVIEFRF